MNDRREFERQAVPHLGSAYRLAYSLLRSRHDAEDAVQDSFVRAYRAFGQLRGDLRPWLLTIVRNVCYRQLQHRRGMHNVISLDQALSIRNGEDEVEWQLPSDDPTPEQVAITRSDGALLGRLLAAMPAVYREVLLLREIEGLSYDEIATVTAAPRGTVMSRLSRARNEIRKLLSSPHQTDSSNAL